MSGVQTKDLLSITRCCDRSSQNCDKVFGLCDPFTVSFCQFPSRDVEIILHSNAYIIDFRIELTHFISL